MKKFEIILESNYKSIIYYDKRIILTDIDSLFKETNIYFSKILTELDMDVTFDFSQKYNKTLYTHAFLNIICEHIKTQKLGCKLCFYSNTLTKDVFRNSLLKKLKSIFGFKVYECVLDFTHFVTQIEENHCDTISKLEVFFNQNKTPKTFKHIKKYMEKTGLKAMSDTYFKDIANKMIILS